MAVSLKHAFTSNVADSGDPNLVQPSNWNAEHTLTAGADTLLGAISAGPVVEIPCTAAGRAILDDADAAAQRTTLGLGTGDSPTFAGLTLSGVGSFSAGTALLPSLTTTGDTNTGMWFPADDTIAWSTNGIERVRIDSSGNVGIGKTSLTSLLDMYSATSASVLVSGESATNISIQRASSSTQASGFLNLRKSSGTIASPTAVSSGSNIGTINNQAYDGSAFINVSNILSTVETYTTTNDISGNIRFSTRPTGVGAAVTERMRITGAGNVGIGTSAPDALLSVNGISSFGAGAAATPSVAAFGDLNTGMWFPAADTIAVSTGGTEALRVNSSQQLLVGGTSADAKLTVTGVGTTSTTPSTTTDIGATLGIRSTGAGAGNGGMLMFGSATGYFGAIKGFLQNGTGPQGTIDFYTRNLSSDATLTQRMRINFDGKIGIGTGSPDALLSVNGIASFGAGAVGTPSLAAFGDTNTGMWFPAADTIAWSTGGSERMRISSVGNVGIGTTSITNVSLRVSSAITGSTSSFGIRSDGVIQSDATTAGVYYLSSASTAAASFTVNSLSHFYALQAALGAGSSVTNQYGFRADGSLIDATDNYSFIASNTSAIGAGKTSYGFYSGINNATGGGTTYAFYAAGSALNYFNGQVAIKQTLWNYAPAPSAQTAAATLTAANLKTGIITATGTSYTLTLPTGTDIDTGFTPLPGTGLGFDFYIVNNASGTVTLGVNTGVTSSGTLTVATGVSAHFRLRRTAANTYVVYRLS